MSPERTWYLQHLPRTEIALVDSRYGGLMVTEPLFVRSGAKAASACTQDSGTVVVAMSTTLPLGHVRVEQAPVHEFVSNIPPVGNV